MGKQEKSAKKAKKGKEKAEEIIAETKEKFAIVKTPYDSERKEGIADDVWLLGCRVRELRDQGEPWWAIARDLELEGFGASAVTGKKGAARARTAYKAAFGDFPRTFTRGAYKGAPERNEHVAEMKKLKRHEAKAKAKAGKSVISKKMSDEDVAKMLKGRRIRWYSNETVPDGLDQEVCIHPKFPLYIIGEGKDRVIEFREQHRRAPIDVRGIPAQTRTVRLRQIYSVK